jgi:hypothetical protein
LNPQQVREVKAFAVSVLDSSLAISKKIKGAIESAEHEAHISSSLEQFTEMV